jgi:hypothetical protein
MVQDYGCNFPVLAFAVCKPQNRSVQMSCIRSYGSRPKHPSSETVVIVTTTLMRFIMAIAKVMTIRSVRSSSVVIPVPSGSRIRVPGNTVQYTAGLQSIWRRDNC